MKRILFTFLIFVSCGNSAKILGVFPFPSKSHHIIGSALLKELAKRGHEVTMISPYPLENPPERYEDVHLRGLVEERNELLEMVLRDNQSMLINLFRMFNRTFTFSRKIAGNKDLHAFLGEGRKYDLVIIKTVIMNEALFAVSHAVNATMIGFSILGSTPMHNFLTGNPAPYAYVPSLVTEFTDDMNFLERVVNTTLQLLLDLVIYFIVLPYQRILLKEFFPNSPPLEELIDQLDLTLINSHIATESPRPYLPNLIQIGGFHLQEKQHLPVDLELFLNSSKHGVIYFSLGTNAKSTDFPNATQKEILEAFRRTKYDVLWVFDGDLHNKPKNVIFKKWVPQRAVLAHENVKVFITHAGLGSTAESIYFGKPMICIPLFADQHKNAADSVSKGIAISLNKDVITKELLISAINTVLNTPVYKDNAKVISDIYRNQEINPMDKAVFWVEHVLKHKGAKHLKARAAYIPLYQYWLLDIIVFFIAILLLTSFVFYYCLRFICKFYVCKVKKIKTF